jgi:hypothetical protein
MSRCSLALLSQKPLLYRLSCHGVDGFSDVSHNMEYFTGIPSWQYLTPHDTRTAEMLVKAAHPYGRVSVDVDGLPNNTASCRV